MEGRAVLRSNSHCFARDGHCVARAVLRSYLLRSPVPLRFSLRSTKTRERSKRSRLTSPSDRSSRTSPSHRPISAIALLGVTGVGRCCKRLVGVGESAPAFVFFNIIFIWGVYIGLVRQVISPLLDVILNPEFSMLVIGLCSILTTDPGYVTNESSHHHQLVESPVSVFEAHYEVENVEKPLQLDMNHMINTDIEIIFWSRTWCLQLVTFPMSLLLKKILFHIRESDIVGTTRHM